MHNLNVKSVDFFAAYDANDAQTAHLWIEQCMKYQPQMLFHMFCNCATDADEGPALAFLIAHMTDNQRWEMALALGAKDTANVLTTHLLAHLSPPGEEHLPKLRGLLYRALDCNNTALFSQMLPLLLHNTSLQGEYWLGQLFGNCVVHHPETAKQLLPHIPEIELKKAAYLLVDLNSIDMIDYVVAHAGAQIGLAVVQEALIIPKRRRIARKILQTNPALCAHPSLGTVRSEISEANKQWLDNYVAAHQNKVLRKTVQSNPLGNPVKKRRM